MYSELSNALSNVILSLKLTEIRLFKVMFRNVCGVYFLTTICLILEPENVVYGMFEDVGYLFVHSERSSLVFVYDVTDPTNPFYLQTLPSGSNPEGGMAIPSRDLLVVASEKDERDDGFRAVINIYLRSEAEA